jgi:hypothetical protein
LIYESIKVTRTFLRTANSTDHVEMPPYISIKNKISYK